MLFGTKIAKIVSVCHEFGTCVRVLSFLASFMGSGETKNSITDFIKKSGPRFCFVCLESGALVPLRSWSERRAWHSW